MLIVLLVMRESNIAVYDIYIYIYMYIYVYIYIYSDIHRMYVYILYWW